MKFILASLLGAGLTVVWLPAQAISDTDTSTQFPESVTVQSLDCLSVETIKLVRSEVINIAEVFTRCRIELAEKLDSMGLSEEALRASFVTLLAHAMAPYGMSRSSSLTDLLEDQHLDCDNYAMLAGHFGRQIGVDDFIFLGFDGGSIGNHAQLLIHNLNHPDLLLDPTTGVIAKVNLGDLLAGVATPVENIKVFHVREDAFIDNFTSTVAQAIHRGQYSIWDLLYVFHSLDDMIAFDERMAPLWATRNIGEITRSYPSPGSRALQRNLEATWPKVKH